MSKRLSIKDLTGLSLDHKRAMFVIEYSKDFDAQRAAVASGFASQYGYQLREEPEVIAALDRILQFRMDDSHIDASWALMEAVDNHLIARQTGNITASNTALKMIMQHAAVDAFAAEKVEVASDREVMERLLRARKRRKQQDDEDDDQQDDQPEEVSFF